MSDPGRPVLSLPEVWRGHGVARYNPSATPDVPRARHSPRRLRGPLAAWRGWHGEVYKARDTRLDRIVAIKILPEVLAADPQFRERFDREARAIAALNHPHICALYDVGEAPNPETPATSHEPPATTRYLVMEYLEGETLTDRLKKGALPLDQALRYGTEITDALATAHRIGITHRDLKPGNVMLTRSGAKLLDFGLAKHGAGMAGAAGRAGAVVAQGFSPANLSALPTISAALTAQGTILGTFQYMAPEQLEGQDADARARTSSPSAPGSTRC